MVKRWPQVSAAIAVLAAVIWILIGCGESASSAGGGQIKVSLIDSPMNADEVNVSISSIQVHKSGGGWVTVKEYKPALSVNLLEYRNGGSSLTLADCPLAAGHYTMIRLMLSGAEVVTGGQHSPVDLQDVAQTGVKCSGEFTIEDDQPTALVLDFNADRSFVHQGGNRYVLRPVLAMSPSNIASAVTGKAQLPEVFPAQSTDGWVANIYQPGHAGDPDYLVAGADVSPQDGSFRFDVVPQGRYDLQIVAKDRVIVTTKDVVVTAPATYLGVIAPPTQQ